MVISGEEIYPEFCWVLAKSFFKQNLGRFKSKYDLDPVNVPVLVWTHRTFFSQIKVRFIWCPTKVLTKLVVKRYAVGAWYWYRRHNSVVLKFRQEFFLPKTALQWNCAVCVWFKLEIGFEALAAERSQVFDPRCTSWNFFNDYCKCDRGAPAVHRPTLPSDDHCSQKNIRITNLARSNPNCLQNIFTPYFIISMIKQYLILTAT